MELSERFIFRFVVVGKVTLIAIVRAYIVHAPLFLEWWRVSWLQLTVISYSLVHCACVAGALMIILYYLLIVSFNMFCLILVGSVEMLHAVSCHAMPCYAMLLLTLL